MKKKNVKLKPETWGIGIIQKDFERSELGKKKELGCLVTRVNF